MDAATREQVRRLVDRERRRVLGAELDDDGRTAMQGTAHGQKALALAAFEAARGDPLEALALALDELERREARVGVRCGG